MSIARCVDHDTFAYDAENIALLGFAPVWHNEISVVFLEPSSPETSNKTVAWIDMCLFSCCDCSSMTLVNVCTYKRWQKVAAGMYLPSLEVTQKTAVYTAVFRDAHPDFAMHTQTEGNSTLHACACTVPIKLG